MVYDKQSIQKEAVEKYKSKIESVKKLFDSCHVIADPVAFVDSGKSFKEAKEFCFREMQKCIKGGESKVNITLSKHRAEILKKDSEILRIRAEITKIKNRAPTFELSEAQKKCIEIGRKFELDNGRKFKVVGNKSRIEKAFSNGAKMSHNGEHFHI